VRYAFIERHEREHSVRRMCQVMKVHPSGYYAWKAEPASPRAKDDRRLLGLLKHAWLESGGVYGYRKLTLDMRDLGESTASIAWPDYSSSKDCARRLAIDAVLACLGVSLPSWRRITCSVSSRWPSPTSPG